jgi:hypothetical protein
MPCRFSPQAPKTRPALRLSGTKNLHFAKAPFPRFSAEEIYLKQHNSMQALLIGLTDYFSFYNQERRHHPLGYKTPNDVNQTATG